MEVEDSLSESLDVNELYDKLVCLVLSSIVKILEALIYIFSIPRKC